VAGKLLARGARRDLRADAVPGSLPSFAVAETGSTTIILGSPGRVGASGIR
jgi:hypothetical protein